MMVASREESSSMTNIRLDWACSKYSSFGGGTDCRHCWTCAHYPSVILAWVPEYVCLHGLPGTVGNNVPDAKCLYKNASKNMKSK